MPPELNTEVKNYLKKNLKIQWYHTGEKLYVALKLENEIISKIPFEQY